MTFGIEPTGPDTGYGFIKQGEEPAPGVFGVGRFAEKPSRDIAAVYLAEGGYSWNAGIFLVSPQVMLDEMANHAPVIAATAMQALGRGAVDGNLVHLYAASFSDCPFLPVDIAVMEKTELAALAPCSMGWADVGSWSELHRLGPHDGNGNYIHGQTAASDTNGSRRSNHQPKFPRYPIMRSFPNKRRHALTSA